MRKTKLKVGDFVRVLKDRNASQLVIGEVYRVIEVRGSGDVIVARGYSWDPVALFDDISLIPSFGGKVMKAIRGEL